MMDRYRGVDELPPSLKRPASVHDVQQSLFTERLDAVLAGLKVSRDELARWNERGWTSIGPDCDDELEQAQVNEIRFVRDVTRSGLNDATVEGLLSELPRPMNFDPLTVSYNFAIGWVQTLPPEEPSIEELFDEHLDEWLASLAQENLERLRSLRDQVDSLIGDAEGTHQDE